MSDPRTSSGTVDVPGARLAYDTAGVGPALVLLHAGICDRRMWDDVWVPLARRYRVVRYDTRGYGETRLLDDRPYSNRADLVAVLDHLGIDRAALVGVSRSGAIVIDTTLEYPERVSALVPVAAGLSGFEAPLTPAEEAAFAELERLEEVGEHDALVEAEMRVWVDGIGGSPDRVPGIRARVAAMDLEAYRDHAAEPEHRVVTLDPPAAGRLGEIRVPTLVIVGDLDAPETQATARHIADGVAGARLEVLHGVAHLPPMEEPERFVELVEGFVAS